MSSNNFQSVTTTTTADTSAAAIAAAEPPNATSQITNETEPAPTGGAPHPVSSVPTPPSNSNTIPSPPTSGGSTTSAAIMSRSSVRPVRKTPTFSISVPERERVALHVQNKDTEKHSSNPITSNNSRNGNNNGGGVVSPAINAPFNQQSEGPIRSRLVSSSSSNQCSPSGQTGFSGSRQSTVPCTPTGYHERTFGMSAFHATRLLPLLYLGNEGDAGMPDELLHRNIRRVLNVAFDCNTQSYEKFGIQVLHVPLRDCGDEDIGSHFDRCSKWIHEGITKGEGVIIHCRLGVSRSATMAIAYLMTYGISQPTRILSLQHRYRVIPIAEQKPQGICRTCAAHHRIWEHYEDNAERINKCEFHVHPEECREKGELYTDYGDVFTYVSMRREHISPNIGFAMQLRKLNVQHGFRDFLSEMSPGPSDDYCSSLESNPSSYTQQQDLLGGGGRKASNVSCDANMRTATTSGCGAAATPKSKCAAGGGMYAAGTFSSPSTGHHTESTFCPLSAAGTTGAITPIRTPATLVVGNRGATILISSARGGVQEEDGALQFRVDSDEMEDIHHRQQTTRGFNHHGSNTLATNI